MGIEIHMIARSSTIADLVDECAKGHLPFSGPDSLCSHVAAMGYKTTSLYEAVRAAEASLKACEQKP
jgi:hypothetical protein